ncbi:hypothetical protein R5R35_000875 [Gryllus longicercus]|uniref:Dual specificity protein phosphatase 19 n=1 Tax=Gryllus longicercus TaxID=2509291 RepID=A0AAN9VW90_9ORTH
MSLQERIAEQRSKLQPCDTQVTWPNGQVMKEIRTANGISTSVIIGSATGFVVDNKPDLQVANILPGLSLGSQDVVLTPGLLKEHQITSVLSVGVVSELMDPDIKHLFVPLLDLPESDISEVLNQCLSFIDEARKAGGCVFVHCNAGVSRSATIVIAYLMQKGWMFEDAFQMVKLKRPVINPNKGFVDFLKHMDRRKRFSIEEISET